MKNKRSDKKKNKEFGKGKKEFTKDYKKGFKKEFDKKNNKKQFQKINYPGIKVMNKKRKKIFTVNLAPGKKVYDEKLIQKDDYELREWDPKKSKLGAAVMNGIKQLGFKQGDSILYLGAASGTTVSHVSDIVGKEGCVFALDFAPRVVRDLVYVCIDRKNTTPMMADANKPDTYAHLVLPQVDFVFMDIAQKNQTEIFTKNVKKFLKKNGLAMLALKARSVDVTKKPKEIFNIVRKELENNFKIVDEKNLAPFEKDHTIFLVRKLN